MKPKIMYPTHLKKEVSDNILLHVGPVVDIIINTAFN